MQSAIKSEKRELTNCEGEPSGASPVIDDGMRQPFNSGELSEEQSSPTINEVDQIHSDAGCRASEVSSSLRTRPIESIPVSSISNVENGNTLANPKTKRIIRDILEKNTSNFPHGKIRTLTALISAIAALVLGIICKNSTDNLVLQNPIFIGPLYKDVTKVGLFYIKLCLTNRMESMYLDSNVTTVVHVEFLNKEAFSNGMSTVLPYYVDREISSNAPEKYDIVNEFDETEMICRKLKLGSDVVRDDIWNLARLAVGLSVTFGFLMTVILTTTVVWKTINLLPVIAGIFITYLCQSLTFFLFDSELCTKYGCSHGKGTNFAIGSSVCWFVSGIAVMTMQYYCPKNSNGQHRMQKILNVQRTLFKSISISNLNVGDSMLTCSSSSSEEKGEKSYNVNGTSPPV